MSKKSDQNDKNKINFTKLLVHARDEDSNAALSYEEIVDNIKVFYFAGHEVLQLFNFIL